MMRKKINITLYADFDEANVLDLDEDLTDHLIEKFPGNGEDDWDIPCGDIAISSTPYSLDITGIISGVTSSQLCDAIDALLVIPKHWTSHSFMKANDFRLGDLMPGHYHIICIDKMYGGHVDNYWVEMATLYIRIWKDRATAPEYNIKADFIGTRKQADELHELIIPSFGTVEVYRYPSNKDRKEDKNEKCKF